MKRLSGEWRWTEALAGEFLAGLEPAAKRMALHVWRAGEAGIHRSVLYQRTAVGELTLAPDAYWDSCGGSNRNAERLPRPVAANSLLQSYFVVAEFAAAATSEVFNSQIYVG